MLALSTVVALANANRIPVRSFGGCPAIADFPDLSWAEINNQCYMAGCDFSSGPNCANQGGSNPWRSCEPSCHPFGFTPPPLDHPSSVFTKNNLPGQTCTGVQITNNGLCIESHKNGEGRYDDNQFCSLTVEQEVKLDVQLFDVEYATDCIWDAMTVTPMHDPWNQKTFCGRGTEHGPVDLVIPTQTTIAWKTDSSVTYGGFKICAAQPPAPCVYNQCPGGVLVEGAGRSSANGVYRATKECSKLEKNWSKGKVKERLFENDNGVFLTYTWGIEGKEDVWGWGIMENNKRRYQDALKRRLPTAMVEDNWAITKKYPGEAPVPRVTCLKGDHDRSKCRKHAGKSGEHVFCCGFENEISCAPGYTRKAPAYDVCNGRTGDCPEEWCQHKSLEAVRSYQCVPDNSRRMEESMPAPLPEDDMKAKAKVAPTHEEVTSPPTAERTYAQGM